MSTDSTIKPVLPAGFQDFSPADAAGRLRMIAIIRDVYELYGAVPLETSSFQRERVLLGDDATSKLIYRAHIRGAKVVNDPDAITAVRFDLTVPLARHVAANIADLVFPFRRYELGTVYRGDKPGPGRYRGFGQFDFDIVGAETGMADAEIVACMVDVMLALGVGETGFTVRVNSRKILAGAAEQAQLLPGSEDATQLLQAMDKIDKLGLLGVLRALELEPDPKYDPEKDKDGSLWRSELTLGPEQLDTVRDFLTLTDGASGAGEILDRTASFLDGSDIGLEGLAEMRTIVPLIEAMQVDPRYWRLDPTIARGLDYYTGPVFETYIDGHEALGSVYSGGRFDDLVARFTGQSLPSVGASVGVDRFWSLVQELSLFGEATPKVDVFIIRFNPELDNEYMRMAAECRRAGLRVEVFQGYQDQAFGHQLKKVALRDRRAPIILIYGPDDARKGTIVVKNTVTRTQDSVPRADLIQAVLTSLGREG